MDGSGLGIKLSASKIKKILRDPEATAKAIDLVYVNDAEQPGITRIKKSGKFYYRYGNKTIRKKKDLGRIKKLVIPPAWENVWICALENGHLQATGFDKLNRKQYRYHPVWNALRNHTKFYRMIEFGNKLPEIRLAIEKDLSLQGLPEKKVLAAVVSLMERTNIRVGNKIYEKLYGSFGLTTLKDKHVEVKGSAIRFFFKGKKGIVHDVSLRNRKLARIIAHCRDIPGKELFQYLDDEGNRFAIDSGKVNSYIKEISGSDFTAKDFRTWSGTVNAFLAFSALGTAESEAEIKKNIVQALDTVAENLGNTRNVCKKYYVHPLVINLYENKAIQQYIDELESIEEDDGKAGLTKEEKMIMKMLNV